MTQEQTDTIPHRKLGVDLFNGVWDLMEKPDRSHADDMKMLHAAHASRYHWGEIGQPVHFARGEWQIARVYAILGRAEAAILHGQECLSLCQQNNLGDFDLAYAYEAIARGLALNGPSDEYRHYLELAKQAGANIAEADDREHFEEDLATLPAL